MNEYFGYALTVLFIMFYLFLFFEVGKWVGRRIMNWLEEMDRDD